MNNSENTTPKVSQVVESITQEYPTGAEIEHVDRVCGTVTPMKVIGHTRQGGIVARDGEGWTRVCDYREVRYTPSRPRSEDVSATDAAALVRDEFKARGFNRKAVGVRVDRYSLGSTLYITIKNPRLTKEVAEEVGELFKIIRRDEVTGDILGGGNRFVSVRIAY